jgi:hypothetical protein
MRYDNAAARHIGRNFLQTSRHVFIGESMKPISPDTLKIIALRKSEAVGYGAVATMKGGIETRDLRYSRTALEH